MANSRIYPQFFHTLVPSFHTHLMIPEDFFSEYIEGRSVAELKLDFSDKSWEVKLSDRRITDGWEGFVVANDFRIGDVVAFRYVGNLVFHVSNLGPNYYEIEHNDGESLLRKRLHQVDFSSNNGDVCDSEELPKEKKAKTNSEEADAVSSSSSADKSCFMAIITALDLTTDTLYLPLHFTSANGLTRKNREIILTDGGERSRVLDLRFDESSGTFYISRGWRNFCDENGQKAGGFFLFKLVGKGETLVLSFCPTESINGEENITREDSKDECSSLDSLMNIVEKKKYIPKPRGSPYSSYSPSHKQFVTFTLPPDYARIGKLSLSAPFVRENGINKPGEICLLDKHGRKWLTSLLLDSKGTMSLGKGWKEFVKANSLETGFTLKLIWEETTPVLSLCSPESNSDREQEEISKAIEKHSLFIDPSNRDKISNNDKEENMSWERKKDHLKSRDSTLSSQKQFVTITITPSSDRLRLPKVFTRENGINKPGRITLLGKDGIKQQTNLLFDKANGAMSLGHGWKDFVKDNGLKTGDSFTLKLIWEDQTPVLSLCPADCSIDREAGGGRSETNQKKSLPIEPSTCKKIRKDVNIKDDNSKEKNDKEESKSVDGERKYLRGTYLTPSSQKHFVTLTITPSSIKKDRLILSPQFARKNNIDQPGMIYLLDTDGTKWLISFQRDKKGTMSLGKGWKEFAEANDFKLGESFTMELVWEDTTPMLSLLRTEFRSSKANEKESISSEHKTRESSPTIKNRIVTPALTPEDVKACKLILPSQFMKKIRTVDKERNHLKGRDLNPSCQKQFVTFTITPTCVGKNRLILSAQFARENNINQPGTIYLLDTDGRMWLTTVKRDKKGTMSLGKGWKEFADTNDLKSGDSFTMELIWEDTNPVLSLLRTKFSSSKSNKEESIFLEPKSRDSSSPTIVNRFVTLALTPEDVTACKLILPSQFMKANGINNKLGKITLLGENGVEWPGYMLSLDGTLALGNGWEGFCEANGVKLGQTFTLEFVNEQDTTTTPVLKFSSMETIYKNVN